jgi:hypothetical protein
MSGGGGNLWRGLATRLLATALFYAVALVLCALLFLALLRSGAVGFSHILFYDGLWALAAGFAPLLVCLNRLKRLTPFRAALSATEELSAALVASSLLCVFFVIGPVTVDRSISIFLLSRFDAAEQGLSATEAREIFVARYVGDFDQIGRRLDEQERSGNLARNGERYALTPQGRAVMRSARSLSELFGADPRFVEGGR